jgi:hypothetical protein
LVHESNKKEKVSPNTASTGGMKMPRKGLPKKYAQMGFKKGWAEYKKVHGTKRTSSPKRTTSKKRSTPRRSTNMAKRKKRASKPRTSVIKTGLGLLGAAVVADGFGLVDAGKQLAEGNISAARSVVDGRVNVVKNNLGQWAAIGGTFMLLPKIVNSFVPKVSLGSFLGQRWRL